MSQPPSSERPNKVEQRVFGKDVSNVPRPLTNNNKRAPVVISVEAAIGTGKSTLLKVLQSRRPNWIVVQEPVEKWQDVRGHNLLNAFYKDLQRWAFSFQTYCVLSRIETVQRALERCTDETSVVVLERSWFSDRHTFAEMLRKQDNISGMEWALYDEWYKFAVRNSPTIHGHVYLDCHTDTCMARLRKRCRNEEVGVTTDYQRQLIERHEDWLNTVPTQNVCRINVDSDFLGNEVFCNKVVSDVSNFADGLRSVSQ
jgi:deoxyadenosine/deoxycytidine kinase